jgi:hypothetical protein
MTQREIFDMNVWKACDSIPLLIAWVHIRVRKVPTSTIIIPVRSISGII